MLLFLLGGMINLFVLLYLLLFVIVVVVLLWYLMIWFVVFVVVCYVVFGFDLVLFNMDNLVNLFDYYCIGMWVNFMVSVGLIVWFVVCMLNVLC